MYHYPWKWLISQLSLPPVMRYHPTCEQLLLSKRLRSAHVLVSGALSLYSCLLSGALPHKFHLHFGLPQSWSLSPTQLDPGILHGFPLSVQQSEKCLQAKIWSDIGLIFLIQLSAYGQLGCFHILAAVNSAAVNTGMYASFKVRVFILSRYIPNSRIAGSYGSSIFLVFKTVSILFSIATAPIYIPTNSVHGMVEEAMRMRDKTSIPWPASWGLLGVKWTWSLSVSPKLWAFCEGIGFLCMPC